jgi:hypothetical protein
MDTSSTPEQPQLLYYQGQPITAELAAAKRAELLTKPEYANAFDNNDAARLIELKDYWMLSRGLVPSPPPAATVADVSQQSLDREQLSHMQHDAVLRQFELTDEARHEIVHRCPVSQAEKDRIAEQHTRAMKDQAFIERLNRRERAAVRDAYIANAIKVAPLARSQSDIDAWRAAHPFTARS